MRSVLIGWLLGLGALGATEGAWVELRAPGGPRGASTSEQREAAGVAHAAAEQALRTADADAAGAERCVRAFVAAYNDHPLLDAIGDELLYQAGRCAATVTPGRAHALWSAMLARYPRSPLGAWALHAMGSSKAALGMYEAAAGHLERFAALVPSDPAAGAALQQAIELRAGLGDVAAARADGERWLKLYGAKRPEEAAALHMAGWRLARDDGERLLMVEAYLRQHARHGGPERALLAELEAGRLLWSRSCAVAGDGPAGLCVTGWGARRESIHVRKDMSVATGRSGQVEQPVTVKRGGRQVCAAAALWSFTVHPREASEAAAAQVHLARVAEQAGKPGREDSPWALQLRDALALALMLQADQQLERLMATGSPQDLDLGGLGVKPSAAERARHAEAMRRFGEFHRALTRDSEAVERGYVAVYTARSPRLMVAAARRMQALARTNLAAMYGVPAPRKLKDTRVLAAYCGALDDAMTAWRERERAALWQCVDRGVITGEFGVDARACAAELEVRAPREFPPLAEIVPVGGPVGWEPESLGVEVVGPEGAASEVP
jgi:hypothetical protein